MKKYIIIFATASLLALSNAVVLAGSGTDSYQSMPGMQQPTYSSSPSATTSPAPTPEQSTTTKTPTQQNATGVTIQDFAFTPTTITVPVGTTVTWSNKDSAAHTVTGNTSGGPDSGTLQTGQSYSFTFTSTGTFPYHCSIHPTMTGTVVVTEVSSPPASPGTTENTTPSSPSVPSAPSTSPTPAVTQTEPSTLPNTGAGNALLAFGVAAVAGTIGHTLYLLRKASAR